MTGKSILSSFSRLPRRFRSRFSIRRVRHSQPLHALWLRRDRLPAWVLRSPVAMRYLDLLGPLPWGQFPERDLHRNYGQPTFPYAVLSAACLVKIDQGLASMGDLLRFLHEHPALLRLLGGLDVSFPTRRHLTYLLRRMPNTALQFLLEGSITLIQTALGSEGIVTGECISLDTKHIIAWVKENNPKAYVEESRFDKSRQPKGDPDCKLGCKRRHNQGVIPKEPPGTPARNAVPASTVSVGEFYWGYASGVVATFVPAWGEFVLAELTQPFDRPDVSYFFPLMAQVEHRLGFRPRFGAFDAAFDAFYVYEYFHREDDPEAFAAIPFSPKGGYKAGQRQFSPDGVPLCAAELPMVLKTTFTDRTRTIIPHTRGKYACPLASSEPIGQTCPVRHKRWTKGGCTVDMPLSVGARLRHTLERNSDRYWKVYRQRTAVERIFSQAVRLGIERPHFRNGHAIANLNTLTYVLINLRFYRRIRQRLAAA